MKGRVLREGLWTGARQRLDGLEAQGLASAARFRGAWGAGAAGQCGHWGEPNLPTSVLPTAISGNPSLLASLFGLAHWACFVELSSTYLSEVRFMMVWPSVE